MDSDGLVITEVEWREGSGNPWLLAEIYDLLLRKPDLTKEETPVTMLLESIEEGGE